MNNPFDYEPSGLMLEAQQQLIAHIQELCKSNDAFKTEVEKGKMFGILRVEQSGENTPADGEKNEMLLYAFSGQIGGRFNWPGFVPAVFDYLDEDGYFKVHEREISAMNRQIKELESAPELLAAKEEFAKLTVESEKDIEDYRLRMKAAKLERDLIRGKGLTDENMLIRESQFMKAELHRKKMFWREQLNASKTRVNELIAEIRSLKLRRQHKSDALQRWLFAQFVFTNPQKAQEKRNLLEIFEKYNHDNNLQRNQLPESLIPPSGSGECCEPKLLHYAIENDLKPLEIGMFWWGESPKQEIRHHLQFYPACNGKCKPILETMACFWHSAEEENTPYDEDLEVIYEDDSLMVVNKPSGMLSVPGRSRKPSVLSLLRTKYPDYKDLQMVHRLDMDTSGLLVVAKTKEAHKHLQRQFAEHTIKKEYTAILSHPLDKEEGTISLPLRPDYEDRPRQIVDHINGKQAITKFRIEEYRSHHEGETAVRLYPLTGRTHQLRVHCAHKEGLGNPIKGDRLYGKKAERLFLHAEYLEFTHPETGKRWGFRVKSEK